MRTNRWLPILLALACSLAHARPSTSVPPVNQPLVGPQAALERFADAYRDRAPDSVLANLTLDYRFHTLGMGDSLLKFTIGSDREMEAHVIRGMLHGVIRNGDTLMAPADSVGMTIDGISEGVDPEHPDSTQHYRVLNVRLFSFGVRTTRGLRMNSTGLNIFHVVRGDAALLADGQPADSLRWYVRRWLEDMTGVNAELAGRQGGCGEEPPPIQGPSSRGDSPALPTALAVRPLTNPACTKLEVRCDLPGVEPARVEVYDANGRRVNRRDVDVAAAGTMTIEAGRGAKLYPGVYWVRVGQGLRPPVTRMVVVGR
ncbi:MAG TPA: hypothetical protein VN896_03565 [Methylomirabilota bacterium]|jgi:hypothetical protein|nr:hypothetical protein [Methylomirabilota bacterium]